MTAQVQFPTLGITSPPTKGPRVAVAQTQLKKHGYLGSAKVDGVYGPLTGAAVHKAKYWLGYPSSKCNKTYNDYLHGYLTGDRKITSAMKLRTKLRKGLLNKKSKNEKMRTALVNHARSYVGEKESPSGSNKVLFSRWYGMIGPWCAMFISYVLAVKLGVKFWRYAYVPYVVNDARKNKSKMFEVHPNDIVPGDLMCADWNRDGTYDHIGIVSRRMIDQMWKAIEGNTAVGNDSNGGEVMERDRNLGMGRFVFVRINFT